MLNATQFKNPNNTNNDDHFYFYPSCNFLQLISLSNYYNCFMVHNSFYDNSE